MSKADNTRERILGAALRLTTEVGLEGLTFGVLAKRAEMSKSGLYAHFESKAALQRDVLDYAVSRFVDVVISDALKQPRGEARVRTLFERWLAWEAEEFDAGCPFIAASTDLDDRPGDVREHLKGHLTDLMETISRAAEIAVRVGDFASDLDTEQFAFDVWGVLLAYHHYKRLLDRPDAKARAIAGFDRVVCDARACPRAAT